LGILQIDASIKSLTVQLASARQENICLISLSAAHVVAAVYPDATSIEASLGSVNIDNTAERNSVVAYFSKDSLVYFLLFCH
jgi:hypothetical protein